MITEKNFDWNITNKRLVIFCPNWGRGQWLRHTVRTIDTEIPKDEWLILVCNDGIHEDLSDLEKYNVKYFTFERENKSERNGCFIRNYVIKRLQSHRVFIKDPEIIIRGDFIKEVLECNREFYRLGGYAYKVNEKATFMYMQGKYSIQDCLNNSSKTPILPGQHMNMHYGYSMITKLLQDMNGYDEDFSISPYYEDQDIFYRFLAMGIFPFMSNNCYPIHLWHEMKFFPNEPETKRMYEKSGRLFASKDPKDFIRNKNIEWGTGRKDICEFTK